MKNVALVISQQYEQVNFFCRTQHSKSRDDGRQWEDGGGEEESSGERSNVIRFRAHLEWFECQRLFVDDSSMSILWGVCYSPGKPVRTHLNPPHRSRRASLTGLQTADGSRPALWNGKISCQDRKSCTCAPDHMIIYDEVLSPPVQRQQAC